MKILHHLNIFLKGYRLKILLLEDDKLLNLAITEYISSIGHEIYPLRDGHDALIEIQNNSYDLLILDINVPNINGLELLELLHEHKIHTPTIFISALIDIEDISRAFDLGCHDYLKKPFHLKELTMRINKILQSSYIPNTHIRLSSNYSLEVKTSTIRFKGEVQVFSSRQLQIILLLAQNRSRVVEYDLFNAYVWDTLDVETPTIRAEVSRLKKVLKEDFIINIRNMGYMIKRPI